MKKGNLTAIAAGIILLLTYSNCQGQARQNLASAKKQIEAINAIYYKLFAEKDPGIVTLYTADATLFVPNGPAVSGSEALKKDFNDTYAAGKLKGVKFNTGRVYNCGGKLVAEEGTWQVFTMDNKLLDDGKYLKLWKKTEQGWKIFKDCFNSNHPAVQ